MPERGMGYLEFLERVIDDGLAAAKIEYANDPPKLHGAIAGFEMCREMSPAMLAQVLTAARQIRGEKRAGSDPLDAYWKSRCAELEVEWVCNVVSAALVNEGREPIVPPTARGTMKAAEILGVATIDEQAFTD